jgi:hypothetical protein
MNLINIFESLLLEATPEEIHSSYYSDIPFDTFKLISSSDPGSVFSGEQLKKIGKYTKLLLTMFKRKNLKLEDLPKAKEYLSYVYKHAVPLDVNKIKTLADLYQVVKGYYVKDTKNLTDVLQAIDESEYKKIFQSENWTIFVPLTEKAACYLGVNTEWCTTWGPLSLNPDYKDRTNRFEYHNRTDKLYIIINNTNLNEKYQFHFPTKQFMDKEDKRIDSGEFLEKHTDIRNFFFPSFVKDDLSQNEILLEIGRLPVLSPSDSTKLIEKVSSKLAGVNPLIRAIINRDEDEVNKLITDPEMKDTIDFNGTNISFYFDKLAGDLSDVESVIGSYKTDIHYSVDRIYDDISNEDDEWRDKRLEGFFEMYYKENINKLKSEYGILDYEKFKTEFFDNFKNDNRVNEEVYNEYTNINVAEYESTCQELINDIKKYISFVDTYRDNRVDVNIGYFILFLGKENIQSVPEYVEDLLSNYINHYNIETEYEGVYEYNHQEPKYEGDIQFAIEKYFDTLFDDFEGTQECTKLRLQLSNIIQKLFKGSTTFENDKVRVEIPNLGIDCETQSVNIIFWNKETGKKYEGAVKIENLPSYVTNYKLFESIIDFKRFL